ncbi:MAG TPA: phage scaffolding protein [Fervidobacterium sp.]|nr:phage scaffolding protein [Fervidobacterium sp.]
MDWLKELLKDVGVGDEKLNELISNINKEIPKYFIPKSKYNEVAEAKKQLEEEINVRNTQLEELKKSAGENENLKRQIEELQSANKQKDEEYQRQIKDLQITNAIKLALSGKVHDEDIVSQLIKKDELVLSEDGKVIGLDEQINSLKETKGFLFIEEKQDKQEEQPGFQKVGNEQHNNHQTIDDAISAAFGN